jgi:macrolide transport system ATP-binding/permease protein
MTPFLRKLRSLARSRRREAELDEELQFHLDEEIDSRTAEGVPIDEARYAARRDLGSLAIVREDTRAAWTWTFLEQLVQDVRYGARTLAANKTFSAIAILSLALGIGANTAIYSFLDALLMRSLPVADPGSLVVLKWHFSGNKNPQHSVVHDVSGFFYDDPKTGRTTSIFPYPAFDALRNSSALSVLFAYRPAPKLNVVVLGQAEVTNGEYLSGDYFPGLGLVPAAGRLIAGDDDREGAPAVAVLGHGFAQRRFGDVASAVGQTVLINSHPFTAIGVVPPGFFGVDPSRVPDVYIPFHADLLVDAQPGSGSVERYLDEHYYWTEMMGRLRPGITLTQAQAALAPVFEQWVASTANGELERANLPQFFLKEGGGGLDNLRRRYSQSLYILLAMVGLILAIACANIANLLLARATARRREMAVRLSIGAGRWRVVRQLLTESLLLASLGGAAGSLFAVWGIRFLTTVLAAGSRGFTLHAELNVHVLAAALLLTLTTGLVFGLAPALQATHVDPMSELRQIPAGAPRSRAWFGFVLGRTLVISQMAICLLLLVAAGLFARTLSNLQSLEMGFQREGILLFKLNARQAGHRDPEMRSFYSDLEKRLAALPGIHSAAMANSTLIGDGAWAWPVIPFGQAPPENAPSGHGSGAVRTATRVLGTGPRFFSTMRIPLLAGREFDEHDRVGALPVAMVNEAWVKANHVDGNPVGQRVTSLRPGMKPSDLEIVGLARNARYDDLTGDFPAVVYLPVVQNLDVPVDEMTFFLRTAGNSLAYASAVREIVRDADPRIPVEALSTQAAQIENELSQETLFAQLSAAFAMLALAIACVGLYGTTSYTVARRTGEIGIRMALGARRRTVVWMVLSNVLVLAIVGLAIGLPVAVGASKLVESLLFGVKPSDPSAVATAVAILLSAALAAGYRPAWKASRIDPVTAIRHE